MENQEQLLKAVREGACDPAVGKQLLQAILHREGDWGRAAETLGRASIQAGPDRAWPGLRDEFALAEACRTAGRETAALDLVRSLLGRTPVENRFLRNKFLNFQEYLEKRVTLESRPVRMIVSLTHRCNLKCIMCYEKNFPSWDLPEPLARSVEEFFPYLEFLQWQGGEIFVYPDFTRLFDRAAACPDLQQSIVTNGLLLNEEWAEKLAAAGSRVCVSIDGFTRETYEKVRAGGSFDRLLQNLDALRRARRAVAPRAFSCDLSMNFVVLRSNYTQLERLADFAAEYGFGYVRTFAGDTTNLLADDPHKAEDVRADREIVGWLRKTMPAVQAAAEARGVRFRNDFPLGGEPGITPAQEPPRRDPRRCHAPWSNLFVVTAGEVRPDCFCRVPCAAGGGGLAEQWNNEGMRRYRQKLIEGAVDGFCSEPCLYGALPDENLRFQY